MSNTIWFSYPLTAAAYCIDQLTHITTKLACSQSTLCQRNEPRLRPTN